MASKLAVSLFFPSLFLLAAAADIAGDAAALLALKSSLDHNGLLPWREEDAFSLCSSWVGVHQCSPLGRVTKLVLEFYNLTGALDSRLISPLDQLRVLSFKSNSLSGVLPDFSPLVNLKSLYLANNRFSGSIPPSLSNLHRIKILSLSSNLLSGSIPEEFAAMLKLYSLFLQDNQLTGRIPAFQQSSLMHFNVSGNNLSGEIPATKALSQFYLSSFLGNVNLCGIQVGRKCQQNLVFPPSPNPGMADPVPSIGLPSPVATKQQRKHIESIIAGAVAGGLALIILCIVVIKLLFYQRNTNKAAGDDHMPEILVVDNGITNEPHQEQRVIRGGDVRGRFSWETEGIGKLVFCGGIQEPYSLDELLRASAETLGRGTVGSTYKAVMESGYIVTVKRLREGGQCGWDDEWSHKVERIGMVTHPNLVPLRAYFQAKDERLLVYDYFPNGSLFSLIHGSRPSGHGKPLHWTSCLKIAEDLATGLLQLHEAGLVHGNLKPTNVLLGADFESCLTDYSLIPSFLVGAAELSSSMAYRAPEIRRPNTKLTESSDVYSFGVLMLELLTGRTPAHELIEEDNTEIGHWVKSVRAEEQSGESGGDDKEKLAVLMGIVISCLVKDPVKRPAAVEVVKMVRAARADAMGSSGGSTGGGGEGHSPGRWSGSLLTFPQDGAAEQPTGRD